MIALTLSGGGSRAIAFHVGCLRALHDRGVLQNVSVISAVSGGSVIAGVYAYGNAPFDKFDDNIVQLLRRGLQRKALLHLFSPHLLARVVFTNLVSRPIAAVSKVLNTEPPLRRWASRTDALEESLSGLYGELHLPQVARPNLDIVFNACELRTGTAFRFGNQRSGNWRLGEIKDNRISVAHAVTCSAAYPMLLPAVDRKYTFIKDGSAQLARVIITDGGVYDNVGVSCVEPGRDKRYNLHVYQPDYIICCHAGHGQFGGKNLPYGFYSRTAAAFEAVFRKTQDATINRLHMHLRAGNIRGFVLPYLGQQDNALPLQPAGLVRREEVAEYPTDFAAMTDSNISRLTRRGEQLTRILLNHYCPEI